MEGYVSGRGKVEGYVSGWEQVEWYVVCVGGGGRVCSMGGERWKGM